MEGDVPHDLASYADRTKTHHLPIRELGSWRLSLELGLACGCATKFAVKQNQYILE